MCPFSLSFGPAKSVPLSLLLWPSAASTGEHIYRPPLRKRTPPPTSYILCTTAFWSMNKPSLAFYMHSRPLQHMHSIFMSLQLRRLLLVIQPNVKDEELRGAVEDSRSIFVTAVKDEERIRFPEEVLLIQLVATELQHHRLLKTKPAMNKVSVICLQGR